MTHTEIPTFFSQFPQQSLESFITDLNQIEKIEIANPPEIDALKRDFQIVKSSFLAIAGSENLSLDNE